MKKKILRILKKSTGKVMFKSNRNLSVKKVLLPKKALIPEKFVFCLVGKFRIFPAIMTENLRRFPHNLSKI